MKRIIIVLMGLIFGQFCKGQTFSEDMAKVNNSYINFKQNFVIKSVFADKDQILARQEVKIQMKNINNYFMSSDETQVLVSNGLKISLNQTFKVVMLDSNFASSIEAFPTRLFDTMATRYSSIKTRDLEGNIRVYDLVPAIGTVKSISIYFNKGSYKITKMSMVSWDAENQKNVAAAYKYIYSAYTPLPSIDQYVKKSSGSYALNPKWKGYELLNYLKLQN